MSPNDADGMENSVDPDQTAPLGAVWSGSALFAQAYLSENLGSLRYIVATLFFLSKDTKWASSWEKLLMQYANNKGADQPAHGQSDQHLCCSLPR